MAIRALSIYLNLLVNSLWLILDCLLPKIRDLQTLCFASETCIKLLGGISGASGATTKDRINIPAGTYTVTATDMTGCTKTATFTINPYAPTLTVYIKSLKMVNYCKTPWLCNGAIDIEPAGGTAPYTYAWSGPFGFTSTAQDITGLCMGKYYLTLTDGNGCTTLRSYRICCCDAPLESSTESDISCLITDFTISGEVKCASSTSPGAIMLTVTGIQNSYSLVWKKNNFFYSYEQNLTNLLPGVYCVTISNGCTTKSKCFTVLHCEKEIIAGRGVSDDAFSGFKLREFVPNPFSSQIAMQVTSGHPQEIRGELLNINGQPVQNRNFTLLAGDNQLIWSDLNFLPAGTYILRLVGAEGKVENRMVVKGQ